jgi:hypothetical protein
MSSSGTPTWRRSLSIDGILGLILALGIAHSYWTYIRLPLTRPSPGDYDQASADVRSRYEPGDLVIVQPFWAGRARQFLGDLPLVMPRVSADEDLTAFRRLWLFSSLGRVPASGRDGLAARADLIEQRQYGRIDLRLYRVRGHRPVVADFREQLDGAAVWTESSVGREACVASAPGRFRCGPESWHYVGREILEIAGEPRAVIWAHPVTRGTLAIGFRDVVLGTALSIAAGFTPAAVRHGGAPVRLAVAVDGTSLWQRSYESRAEWPRETVDTASFTATPHTIVFRVTTTDDRVRHFVFAADARR